MREFDLLDVFKEEEIDELIEDGLVEEDEIVQCAHCGKFF